MSLSTFIAGLPKAELHVHHVGSASPRIVSELAARHPGVVPSDPDELRSFFEFRDFAHFIEVYLAVVDLIRTPEDVRLLTYEVAREMAGQQIRYAELTCTPYTSVVARHPDRGVHRGDRGRPGGRRAGLRTRAALDLRHPGRVRGPGRRRHPRLRARPPGRGPDRLRPRRSRGRRTPAAVPAALRRRPRGRAAQRPARRRDHRPGDRLGRAAAARAPSGSGTVRRRPRTPTCSRTSPSTGIPLEVCPSSNVATRAVAALDDHPIVGVPRRRA